MSDQMCAGMFCWFECASTEAVKAKPFYAGLFDWNAEDLPMPGDPSGSYTMFRVGDADMAGLYQMSGPQFEGVPSHWITYVQVDSADDTAERAAALGGKLVMPLMDVPGVGRIGFVQDPTAAIIGIFQPGERRGCGQPASSHGAMGWSELATNDTAKARTFYCELFGWGAKEEADGSYTEFQVGGRSIGGLTTLPEEQKSMPPNWMPYVAVDDCDACSAKVAELGGKTLVPPTHIPGVGSFSVFMDPAGACLSFIQLDEPSKEC